MQLEVTHTLIHRLLAKTLCKTGFFAGNSTGRVKYRQLDRCPSQEAA